MQKAIQIIYWLNGKKTNIGAILLFAATTLIKITAIWQIEANWVQPTIDTLEYLGSTFAVVGLGHQAIKKKKGSDG